MKKANPHHLKLSNSVVSHANIRSEHHHGGFHSGSGQCTAHQWLIASGHFRLGNWSLKCPLAINHQSINTALWSDWQPLWERFELHCLLCIAVAKSHWLSKLSDCFYLFPVGVGTSESLLSDRSHTISEFEPIKSQETHFYFLYLSIQNQKYTFPTPLQYTT